MTAVMILTIRPKLARGGNDGDQGRDGGEHGRRVRSHQISHQRLCNYGDEDDDDEEGYQGRDGGS